MADVAKINILRNCLAGLLWGYGIAAIASFFYLMEHWASLAPAMADPAHNLVFPHQVKERTVYFSAFQATACGLLRSTSICSGCLGLLIAVKKNIVYGNGRFNLGARWEADDPQNLFRWAFALGLLLTPIGIFLIGPDSVYWLNEKGFTIGG